MPDPILLSIEKTVFGGEGLAHHEGKACFVEGAMAGEKVLAKIIQDKKKYLRAKTVRVIEASPERVTPPCRYIEKCGGCQYQHMSYSAELAAKEAQVREMMSGVVPAEAIESIRFSEKEYHYRNSVTMHLLPAFKKNPAALGFVGVDNKSLLYVEDCLLADKKLTPVFSSKWRVKSGHDKINFKLSEKGEILSDWQPVFFRIQVRNESLLASSKGFFQNNLAVTALIAEEVKRCVDTAKPSVFYDLYGGVGTFSFLSARQAAKVICIEESPDNVEALEMNRQEKGWPGFQVHRGRVEKIFPEIFMREKQGGEMIFLDPPRQGMQREMTDFLTRVEGIQSILYLSCDPATMARDLKMLSAKYRIRSVIPFDMFPKTKHIEALAQLEAW